MIIFHQIIMEEILGFDTLYMISLTSGSFIDSNISNVKTIAPFIFQIYFSFFTMKNVTAANFTPQFLFASLSNLVISDNFFLDSFSNNNNYEIGAIQLTNNVTFFISNNIFRSLKNFLYGPVNKYLSLLNKLIIIRLFPLKKCLEFTSQMMKNT